MGKCVPDPSCMKRIMDGDCRPFLPDGQIQEAGNSGQGKGGKACRDSGVETGVPNSFQVIKNGLEH
jgi:hypothetical protein